MLLIEHAQMNINFRWVGAGNRLKFDPEPAVAALAASSNCVSKSEESCVAAALVFEPFQEQVIFVIQHGLEPPPADIALRRTIDSVADGHIVGGNGLGHGLGGSADAKEPAGNLLPGADLREGAITPGILVDPQRLLPGFELFVSHIHWLSIAFNRA